MKRGIEIGVDLLGKEEAEEIHGVAEEKEEVEMVEGDEDGVDGLIKYEVATPLCKLRTVY